MSARHVRARTRTIAVRPRTKAEARFLAMMRSLSPALQQAMAETIRDMVSDLWRGVPDAQEQQYQWIVGRAAQLETEDA